MFVLKFPADPQVCLHFLQVRHVHTSTHLNTTIHPSIQYIYIYIDIYIDIDIYIYMYMHIHIHIICPKKFVNSSWLIMVNSNFSHDISPHFSILPAASSPAALWALPAPSLKAAALAARLAPSASPAAGSGRQQWLR